MERMTERDGLCVKAKFTGDFGTQNILHKLADYEDLEEQGLLITLPCKLNEMVYIAHKKYPTHKGLFVSKADIVSCLEEGYVIGSTKEEALQKLKELENV